MFSFVAGTCRFSPFSCWIFVFFSRSDILSTTFLLSALKASTPLLLHILTVPLVHPPSTLRLRFVSSPSMLCSSYLAFLRCFLRCLSLTFFSASQLPSLCFSLCSYTAFAFFLFLCRPRGSLPLATAAAAAPVVPGGSGRRLSSLG